MIRVAAVKTEAHSFSICASGGLILLQSALASPGMGDYLRRNPWQRILLASAIVLIPVFWLPRIEACDLGSHTYNSWLRQLVSKGQAPGVYLVSQSQNVLFDDLLYALTRTFGFVWGERFAVGVSVLIFFWSVFVLASAFAQKPAWPVVPLVAMLCYGWVFNMGFFNMYLSVGLSFAMLALLWRWRWPELLLLAPLAFLVWRAHIFGAAWVICGAAYILTSRRLALERQIALFVVVLATYFLVRHWVINRFETIERETHLYWTFGADQFVIYGNRYEWLAFGLGALVLLILVLGFARDWRHILTHSSVPLQLLFVLGIAVLFAPGGIMVRGMAVPLSLVPDRASVLTAAMAICCIACLRLRSWQVAAFACLAGVYFSFLFSDMATANAMEKQVEALVQQLPSHQRVVAILEVPGIRVVPRHIVDRACIRHCFSYANYEPSSREFRVRARPGNPVVTANATDSDHMQQGEYVVQARDLPLYEIYFCGVSVRDLCLTQLSAGQVIGNLEENTPLWR